MKYKICFKSYLRGIVLRKIQKTNIDGFGELIDVYNISKNIVFC